MSLTRNRLIAIAALILALVVIGLALVLLRTRTIDYPAPPRIETQARYEAQSSVIATRAIAPLGLVGAKLEEELPATLVTINKRIEECVPRETVRVLGRKLFKTPKVSCELVGEVTRGAIALSGSGPVLRAAMPINARIEVRNVGDLIKRETITAAADVTMDARLRLAGDWSLDPEIALDYRWRTEPGIDIAGQRVTFTKLADAEIAKSMSKVESLIEAEIRKVDLRSEIAKVWADAHDTISVNRENPPVWLRITPSELGAGALSVSGENVAAELMLRAALNLKVGERPEPPTPGPLGRNQGVPRSPGFSLNVPVLADYREVEPVLLKALQKLADKQLTGGGGTGDGVEAGAGAGAEREAGPGITARFEQVTIHATENGKIAVGVTASVAPTGFFAGRYWARAGGTVWLTGTPLLPAGSEKLRIEDLAIYGDMDRTAGDLLIGLLGRPVVRETIEQALVTDFEKDYQEIVAKATKALKSVKVGPARLSFDIERFEHGAIEATGAGLYLPVIASGSITARVAK